MDDLKEDEVKLIEECSELLLCAFKGSKGYFDLEQGTLNAIVLGVLAGMDKESYLKSLNMAMEAEKRDEFDPYNRYEA